MGRLAFMTEVWSLHKLINEARLNIQADESEYVVERIREARLNIRVDTCAAVVASSGQCSPSGVSPRSSHRETSATSYGKIKSILDHSTILVNKYFTDAEKLHL